MSISNSNDIIDSRDVIARIDDLEDELKSLHDSEVTDPIESLESDLRTTHEAELEDTEGVEPDFDIWLAKSTDPDVKELDRLKGLSDFDTWLDLSDDDDAEELKSLRRLAEEGESCSEWRDGACLIREDYFTEYCEELCKDIGDVPRNIPAYLVIDWEATADNLRMDYSEIEYDDVTYLVRS